MNAAKTRYLLGSMLAASVGIAIWSFTLWASSAPAAVQPAVTPTPARLQGAPGIDEARAALSSRSASLATFAAAAEGQRVDAVLDALAWRSFKCDDIMYRGVTECERLSLANGTTMELFVPDGFEVGLQRNDVREAMTFYLRDRKPRLAMVAERSNKSLVLFFLIDPRPHLTFPGAVPAGGGPAIGIWFATVPGDPSRIETYGLHFEGSPPLEFLRYDEYVQKLGFTVLGSSPEFQALEQAFHDKNEQERRQP